MKGTKPGIRRVALRLLAIVAALQILLPVLLWMLRSRILFLPSRDVRAAAATSWTGSGVACGAVEFPGPGGIRLEALDARPSDPADPAAPVVLWLHGNAGCAADRASSLGDLVRATRARVVLLDYAGYGGSGGRPTTDGVVEDALAAYDALVASGVPESRMVLLGESLGGAVAAQVAARRRPAGLVVQATFSSLSSMALRTYGFLPLTALLARGTLDTRAAVRAATCPVLVVHGTDDDLVPPAEGRAVAAAAGARAEHVEIRGAGHNDFPADAGTVHLDRLRDRFRSWTAAPR